MHAVETRQLVLDLLNLGLTRRDVCRILEVGYSSTYRWEQRLDPSPRCSYIRCFRCDGKAVADERTYLYLLGQYLGDGHISRMGRSWALNIYCCTKYPSIIREVSSAMSEMLSASVCFRGRKGACVGVQSTTQHWLCLLPQHGEGRKHERRIVLEPWQVAMVDRDPRPMIRGLLHSDGWRGTNWTRHRAGGTTKTYYYPRYLFSNVSTDVQTIFTSALDRLGIAWRQNKWNSISIARRDAVAALDEFVGLKS